MELCYCKADDWCGIYADNILKKEGHDFSVSDIANMFYKNKNSITSIVLCKVKQKWIEDLGNFPVNYTEIPKDKIFSQELFVF